MAKVPNGVETLPKISTGRMNVTDDRLDRGQTDGRHHMANVNLRSRSLKSYRTKNTYVVGVVTTDGLVYKCPINI